MRDVICNINYCASSLALLGKWSKCIWSNRN